MSKIMIVDDAPTNIKLLAAMLQDQEHKVFSFLRGDQALKAAFENQPDIILLDINMPEMDGFEVCRHLKADKTLKDIPVLFISALTDTADKVQAFKVGGVDYITKPFQAEEVKARVHTHLAMRKMQSNLERHNTDLERLVREKTREVYDSHIATIFALAKLAENRDNDTGKHIERVQTFTKLLAEQMSHQPQYADQLDDKYITNLYQATPLHDIGKVAIPDSILLKPGKLTVEEFEIIKTHTTSGAETLETVRERYPNNSFLAVGVEVTRSHHEKWDGSGYPDGLSGADIPLAGRIMAVADVYDALKTERVYKPAFSHEKTIQIIIPDAGTHFDPGIIEVFKTIASEFNKISEQMAL